MRMKILISILHLAEQMIKFTLRALTTTIVRYLVFTKTQTMLPFILTVTNSHILWENSQTSLQMKLLFKIRKCQRKLFKNWKCQKWWAVRQKYKYYLSHHYVVNSFARRGKNYDWTHELATTIIYTRLDTRTFDTSPIYGLVRSRVLSCKCFG